MFAAAAALMLVALQQQPTPPPVDVGNLPLNLNLTQWIMIMFGGVGLAALGKGIVTLFTSIVSMARAYADRLPSRLEIDEKQRVARVAAEEADTANLEEVNKLVEQLRIELAKNQENTLRFGRIIRKTQHLSNQQSENFNAALAQFNQERGEWKVDKAKMTDTITMRDVALEVLTKENLELKIENERLKAERDLLAKRLKKYETGDLDPSVVPDEDPATAKPNANIPSNVEKSE